MAKVLKILIKNYKNIFKCVVDNQHNEDIPIAILQNKIYLIVGSNNISKINMLREIRKLPLISSSDYFNKNNNAKRFNKDDDKHRNSSGKLDEDN